MNGPAISLVGKGVMFVRIWAWFTVFSLMLRVRPLPLLVRQLTATRRFRSGAALTPARLGRAVWRSLSIAGYRPRCLTASLVLYRLLGEQGQYAEVVIGLPRDPLDNRAHAWIEVDGRDVGPPPGKGVHEELARYGGVGLGGLMEPDQLPRATRH